MNAAQVIAPTYKVRMRRGPVVAEPIIAGNSIEEVIEKAWVLAPQILTRNRYPWMMARGRPPRDEYDYPIEVFEPVPHFYKPVLTAKRFRGKSYL